MYIQNSDFNILYLNVRSLPNHYLELETLINDTNHPEIILLTETWLNSTNLDLYGFDSYIHTSSIRTNKLGRGVSIFSHKNIKFEILPNLSNLVAGTAESVFLQVTKFPISLNKKTVIGVVYCPPHLPINLFLESLD